MMREPEKFLARLREAHPEIEGIFLEGGCFELFRIMRTLWPQARPWHDIVAGHVYVEVDGDLYDIRGKVAVSNPMHPVSRGAKAHRWSRRARGKAPEAETSGQ